ncbi:metal ABC transporter permease [Actinoplanes sp. NPDC026623]|uniref:metal ABC transporter permease n=1 Tax=Actinoplanes sp. NPDC026623 TaxID=3155610 RepID=UPI0033E19AA7
MDLYQYEFMVRALVGALIIGLVAPALGIYLVQRRLSLIGDGIGHVALTGVGVGLLLQQSPVLTAVIVSVVGAIGVELVRERGRTSGDLALALLFYGGIAGGVVLVGLSDNSSNANLMQFLFGSLTTTSQEDLTVIAVLGVAVLIAMLGLRQALFAVCNDEEYARVSGLPVRTLNLLMAVTTAVTVTIAMRTVGLLLVSALMVIPVAAAQQVTRGFRSTMAAAMLIGVGAAAAGITLAGEVNTAPGATIVILAIAVFVALTVGSATWRVLRRRSGPARAGADAEPPDVVLQAGSR